MPENISNTTDQLAAQLDHALSGKTGNEQAPPEGQNYFTGFLNSAISSIPEIVGAHATPDAAAFRAASPVGGFFSQAIPNVLPYVGVEKAISAIPTLENASTAFIEKGANPVTQSARKAIAVAAPTEALKVAGTAVANPDQTEEKFKEGIINTLGAGALGGLFGGFTAGGKVAPVLPLNEAGADLRFPAQEALSKLKAQLPSILPEDQANHLGKMSELEGKVRTELVGDGSLQIDLANDGDARDITRLFKDSGSKAGNIVKSRLIRGPNDFADDIQKQRVINAAGLDGNFDAVQLPRYVAFKTDQWAKKVTDDLILRGKMTAVDDNTLMAREKSGMAVMARKITGEVYAPKAGDEWVVWRTNEPGRFVPDVKGVADGVASRMAFLRQDNLDIDPTRPATIMDSMKRLVADTPIKDFRDAERKYGMLGDASSKIAEHLGYKPGSFGSNFAVNRAQAIVNQYLTPKLYQFKNNPVAKYILGHADLAYSQAKYLSDRMINGEAVNDAAKGFSKIFGDPESTGEFAGLRSIKSIVNSLSNEELQSLHPVSDIIAGSEDPTAAIEKLRTEGHISENLYKGLKDLDAQDGRLMNELVNHQKAAGTNDFNPMKGHFMLSRVWEGDFRAPITDEDGNFVYVAAGKTPGEADKIAKGIIEQSELKGLKHIPAEQFDALGDLKLAGQIATKSKDYGVLSSANAKLRSSPQTFKERTGVGGYKTHFSAKEMVDKLSSHIGSYYDEMAKLSVNTSLEKELSWMHQNDPKAFGAVTERLRQMSGAPGPIGQFINAATDKVLKPALGRNSATKISAFLNEATYHLQLGMGTALFPAMNAITFMQTVLPETAFVMNAGESSIMRDYYDVFLTGGKDLKPRGNVGALSPMKILIGSFKKMANAEADPVYNSMLSQAHREGVIDPQLLNEFIGKSSALKTSISDVMSGDEPLINLVRSFSGWLPSKSERFARGQAFTTGYMIGKDVMGLEDNNLYKFARKFTERTMYNYGTQDRATLMTGPLGRVFGLFKNWQTHYIFSMMQYAEEGAKYGNWSPLMWQMGGTAAVGGISALPMYAVADRFSKMATDKSLLQQVYGQFGPGDPVGEAGGLSDAIFLGLPAFMGVSLAGNVAAPFNDPIRDASQLASFPQWDRMRRLGQAVGDSIDMYTATGQHPVNSPGVRDLFIAALAPKSIARSFQITQDNALRSLNTGNTIMKDMTTAEKLMFTVGITPRRVGIDYAAANELQKNSDKKKALTTDYGRAWAEAQMEQNWDKLSDLREQAMILNLDIASITKSANTYREKKSTNFIERQYSEKEKSALRGLGIPGLQ